MIHYDPYKCLTHRRRWLLFVGDQQAVHQLVSYFEEFWSLACELQFLISCMWHLAAQV